VTISYADHGFFCDARASFNPEAAALAWKLSLQFLEMYVKGAAERAHA
jgi:carboxymethylenebutenolidase